MKSKNSKSVKAITDKSPNKSTLNKVSPANVEEQSEQDRISKSSIGDTSTPTLLNRKDMQEVPVKFTNEIHTAQNNRLFDKDSDWIWLLRKCEKQHFVELDHKDCGEIANIIASKDAEIKELKDDKKELFENRDMFWKENKQLKQQLSQCQEDTAREIMKLCEERIEDGKRTRIISDYWMGSETSLNLIITRIKSKYLKREK